MKPGMLAQLGSNPNLDETDARKLGARLRLNEDLLEATAQAGTEHFSLATLRQLADKHRQTRGEKDIPAHLAICPICLDLFEALLEDLPALPRDTTQRFERLFTRSRKRPGQVWPLSQWGLLRLAAAAILLLGLGFLLKPQVFSNPPRMIQGTFAQATGKPLASGQALQSRKPFTMGEGAQLALDDGGTTIRSEVRSELAFKRTLRGDPLFVVNGGDIWVTAAKQKPGSSIRVQTPLGDIRVIGTEFRVTLQSEQVEVHETKPDQSEIVSYSTNISAVVVTVREGTIALRNRHDQVAVSAGNTAVLRQGHPRIDVRQSDPDAVNR